MLEEDIPRVKRFMLARLFPQIMPDVMLLSTDFVKDSTFEPMSICYDTTAGRFFSVKHRTICEDFSEITQGRFGNEINDTTAFMIGAIAVYMKYHPKVIVCRKADLFLVPRLRTYINRTYTADSGGSGKEFSSDWWAWMAFPSANNDYRSFFSAYRDSIANAEFLRDIPDGVIGAPTVTKQGIYYEVTIFGLP